MTKPEGCTEYKNARKDTKTELARQNGQEDDFYQVQRNSSIRIIAQHLIELPNTNIHEQVNLSLAKQNFKKDQKHKEQTPI